MDIAGATALDNNMPHRDAALILYPMGVSERLNAGNTKCTVYSKRIWTNVHALPEGLPLKNILGCLNKNLTLKTSPEFAGYYRTKPDGQNSSEQWLQIPNIQYTSAGLYTVKLTADFGCFVQDSFMVSISSSTTLTLQTNYTICEGTTIKLAASGEGTYSWSPASGLSNAATANPTVTPDDSVHYKVVLTNSYGCRDSGWVNINVFKKVTVSAGADKTILLGDSILLNGMVTGTAVNFYWSAPISVPDMLTQLVSPTVDTKYTLNAASTAGCGNASADVTIKVYKDVFMTKAFNPNGDGQNDIYHVFELNGYQLISFAIVNRYGVKVFHTTDAKIGWDGTIKGQPQETGSYVFYLIMKSPSGKLINRKGSILLLR